MASFTLTVNGKPANVDVDPDTPLLWVIRDTLGLTGTKYSCGTGICGSCTVMIDQEAIRSCNITIKDVVGKSVTTIEGLAVNPDHPILRAWIEEDVSQCGYCQPGQIMTAAALLSKNPHPTNSDIVKAFSTNLCRCGTYNRITKAVQRAASKGGLR